MLTSTIIGCNSESTNKGGESSIKKTSSPALHLFTLLSPDSTHVNFTNSIVEGPNTNVLLYEYFYNGGGVAVGDLNGDGLQDIYFVGNMSSNKLYLNKGHMKFEDITSADLAGRPGPWSRRPRVTRAAATVAHWRWTAPRTGAR